MAQIFPISGTPEAERQEEKAKAAYNETEKAIEQVSDQIQSQKEFSSLAAYIRSCWSSARDAKKGIQKELYESALQRKGEYTPTKLNEIKQLPGTTIFMNITSVKCRAAEAWIDDSINSQETQIWDIEPTPIPELSPNAVQNISQLVQFQMTKNPTLLSTIDDRKELQDYLISSTHEEIQKQAKIAAQRMRFKIADQLVEANWEDALKEVISDIITYKAGFLKGPIVRRKFVLKWKQDEKTGAWNPVGDTVLTVNYERVSPFDIYPAPTATNIDTGFLIQHHRLTRQDLVDLIGVPEYHEPTIRKVLREYGKGGLKDWTMMQSLKEEAEGRKDTDSTSEIPSPDKPIDALEFWGDAQGRLLLEWGLKTKDIDDPDKEYHINAWLISNYVIKATLNQYPTGKKIYYKTSFENIPGSFWGRGVPEIMKPIQAVCNATARALVNNLGISCLTGDTVVYRDSFGTRGYSEITLKELWEKKSKYNSGLRCTLLRSLNEKIGKFYRNRIVDIFDNGVQNIYEILTEHNYGIKATSNHRFMNSSGEWEALSEFSIGDDIAINGRVIPRTHQCVDCGIMITAKAKRCKKCHTAWHNENQIKKSIENRTGNKTTARQRKMCRQAMKDECEKCGKINCRLVIHHHDRDPWNNELSNLICLCELCHRYEHKCYDNLGDPYKHNYVDYDKIISIKYLGKDRVFDLQMETPNHNFVANGFVSHNSGPQIAADVNQLASGQNVKEQYPWKVWYVDSSTGIISKNKPIEFFQPNSNAGELLTVYQHYKKEADEHTGIPSYTYGSPDVGGGGRALADYEEILTPEGPVEIGSIEIGCLISNSYGSFSKVTGVYPQGESDIFRVKFGNGEHIDCDYDHRWLVRDHHDRKFRTLTTGEILKKGLFGKIRIDKKNSGKYRRPKWMLPIIDFIEFEKREVKIDPYTMGVILGDGSARCEVTTTDKEIFDRIPYELGKPYNQVDNRATTHTIKGIRVDYRSYGLKCKSIDKFIPDDYLYNTKEIRLELLRGLMDTDGCATSDGRTFFCSSSYELMSDFKRLVKSLGGITHKIIETESGEFEIKGRICFRQKSYRLYFNLPDERIFYLERKQSKVKPIPKKHIYITGVEYIGRYFATCISVDSKDELFICENGIPTHNTATGLSILMSNASKGIRYAISNIDFNVIRPSIESLYLFNMLYDKDMGIKGDLKVVTKGAMSLIQHETDQIRKKELLQVLATNPIFLEVIGKRGIANLLREVVKSVNMSATAIVPSEQELDARTMQEQIIAQVQQALTAIQNGQMTPEDLIGMLVQMLGTQKQQQPTKGTPPNPATLTSSGAKAGGVDVSLFMKQPQ